MNVGVVVIGRNEGERLRRCLESVVPRADSVVYVDSGSTDGSAAMARAMGVAVVDLDMHLPFTAARARNEGFRRLRESAWHLDCVQFVDGDSELTKGWLGYAATFLANHENVAAVCGRVREKYPRKTIYNMLCDIEWDAPAGEAKACGGIAMMRVSAFEGARGYRAEMIAGEEPELCVRLRASGWHVWRAGEDMAVHDAAMARFAQWWTRTLRSGYSYAHGAHLHGTSPERHRVRESRRAWVWGLGIPAAVLALALACGAWAMLLLLIYPLQVARLAFRGGRSIGENWWHAYFLVLGKFPEMLGQVRFLLHRCMGRQSRLIEHK
jgi:glycosyltransferase involved in cell wall biosynthesis